ncbi:MAG TPA: polysaccharide deacetylase family protein [Blastocatellia bacterium]|nr:polysaccharide deacetylase family protein [Blastocatellia bacterium]
MKERVFAYLHLIGITRLARWLNRRRVTVLCYHGVTERPKRSVRDPAGLHVRRDRFIAQIDYLKRHYRVISLSDYLKARRERKPLPPYSVVITFDDGYRNFLTVAAQRLAERGLPAAVFLVTDRIREEGHRAPASRWSAEDDEAYLSWVEVLELGGKPGIEIGSHTCTHPKLSKLTKQEIERELKESREAIRARLGGRDIPFAYPYGDYSDCVIDQSRRAGYVCALTTDEGPNDFDENIFALRRTLIGDDDDLPAFAARVSGLAAWIGKAARLVKRPATGQAGGRGDLAPARTERTKA